MSDSKDTSNSQAQIQDKAAHGVNARLSTVDVIAALGMTVSLSTADFKTNKKCSFQKVMGPRFILDLKCTLKSTNFKSITLNGLRV